MSALHLCTAVMAQEHASSRTFPVLQKSDAVLRVFRRKHLLRGSTVLSYCVLPPVHIGQDLVYSGITKLQKLHFRSNFTPVLGQFSPNFGGRTGEGNFVIFPHVSGISAPMASRALLETKGEKQLAMEGVTRFRRWAEYPFGEYSTVYSIKNRTQ